MSLFPLIIQLQRQNPVAQKNFYWMFRCKMMYLCQRYIPNKEIAQEIMGDGFHKFFRAVGKMYYVDDQAVGQFLKKIMINECLAYLRKKIIITEPFDEEDTVSIDELRQSDITAAEIYELILLLPEDCRVVFNLYVLDEMSHKEIAGLLKIQVSTSQKKLWCAKKLLKEMFIKKFGNYGKRKSS